MQTARQCSSFFFDACNLACLRTIIINRSFLSLLRGLFQSFLGHLKVLVLLLLLSKRFLGQRESRSIRFGRLIVRSAPIRDPPFLERAIADCLESPTAIFVVSLVSGSCVFRSRRHQQRQQPQRREVK
jgi:hypothetical protein